MKATRIFTAFFESEKAGGLVLMFATAVSLALANFPGGEFYAEFWETHIGTHSISHWINDGLMAIFFLLIGLELEREIYNGELSNLRTAALPLFGALGGMVVPAGIYLALNYGTQFQSGAGIPMATDIAFAIGVLSLAGNRVPLALKVFLTALAVIDDLGAILVIAFFYTDSLSMAYLGGALGIWAFLFLLNRLKVHNLLPYLIGGVGMWYCMLNSGIHATISGVILAFVIPFGDGSEKTLSSRLQHALHYPVAFFILPLFALANTAITFEQGWQDTIMNTATYGIIAGLFIGKPVGITLFAWIGNLLGACRLPEGVNFKAIFAVGLLGGIGFTMSIFITLLAFKEQWMIMDAKLAILAASLIAGVVGFVALKAVLGKPQPSTED
jgi:NhaA family Na+:H+ antiporter